jgi:hypothetical protein
VENDEQRYILVVVLFVIPERHLRLYHQPTAPRKPNSVNNVAAGYQVAVPN